MTKTIEELKKIVDSHPDVPDSYKRNLLKEYLQFFVLDYIYSSEEYSGLIFYGGSALSQCYELPRLSEDLDFVDAAKKTDLKKLGSDLVEFAGRDLQLPVKAKIQKFRIYLKFPILKRLGMAGDSQSDSLNLKIEVFNKFECRVYGTELKPVFRHNRTVLIKTFDLPTLMATKIGAILHRKWEKTDKEGRTLVSVKGRDYFDLMWYLQGKVRPNLDCIEGVKDISSLKKKLLEIVEKVDSRSIILDLENFIPNGKFVENLGKNITTILKNEIEKME